MTWTSHHESILLAGHKAKKSARAIAADLTEAGYPSTKNTVLGRLFRRGLCKPTQPKEPAMVVDLTMFDGCRWPIGDPGTAGFRFCCDPHPLPGRPYCAKHHAIAYRPRDEKPAVAPKPQRAGTVALFPTTAPMRGIA